MNLCRRSVEIEALREDQSIHPHARLGSETVTAWAQAHGRTVRLPAPGAGPEQNGEP